MLFPISKPLTIITGAGRCGTQFFGLHMSSMIKDCHSEHEPETLFFRKNRQITRRLSRFGINHFLLGKLIGTHGLRHHSVKYFKGLLDYDQALERVMRDRKEVYDTEPGLLVESNYAWWALTGLLPDLAVEFRVISLSRDPLTWIQSVRKRREILDRWNWLGQLPWNRLGDLHRHADPVVRLAHAWTSVYRELQAAASRDDRHKMFRMEDVFGNNTRHFDELLLFAAHGNPERVNWDKSHALRHRIQNASEGVGQTFSAAQLQAVRNICGELATGLGYPGYQ